METHPADRSLPAQKRVQWAAYGDCAESSGTAVRCGRAEQGLGNCHDNAVAENREEAWQNALNYIEMFYNPKRRHGFNNGLSPVAYERQYFERLQSV